MAVHVSQTPLPVDVETAFDYLTTAACWKEWHAASLGTEPDDRRPQPEGATFDETIRAAGVQRRLHWRVVEARRPYRWAGEATIDDGSRVALRYDFAANGEGTMFTRTLEFSAGPLWLRVFVALIGGFRIRHESAVALRELQQRLARRHGEPAAAVAKRTA